MHAIASTPPPCPALPAANEADFVRRPARLYNVFYRLKNDAEGTVPMISRSRTGATLRVMEIFGEQLRACSARVQQ